MDRLGPADGEFVKKKGSCSPSLSKLRNSPPLRLLKETNSPLLLHLQQPSPAQAILFLFFPPLLKPYSSIQPFPPCIFLNMCAPQGLAAKGGKRLCNRRRLRGEVENKKFEEKQAPTFTTFSLKGEGGE